MLFKVNKKRDRVFFYNGTLEDDFPSIDEEFIKLWRGASVEHLDEKKIEEYLQKHGISTVKDLTPKRIVGSIPKRKERKRTNKIHNEHLQDVLEDYTFE